MIHSVKDTQKPASIKEVAEAAGVSLTTVSLVLNGKGRISTDTRHRVQETAQALGFIPNKSAARLRSGRSLLLGLVVNDISNPFFAELSSDLEAEAASSGYLSVIANTGDDLDRQSRVIDTMIGQGVAGLVVSAASGSDVSSFARLRVHNVPYVLAVREVSDPYASFVGFDNVLAGRTAADHLAARGHRRIAFVGGPARNQNRAERLAGARDALRRRCIDLPDAWVRDGPATRTFGAAAMADLIRAAPDVTAVICFNDTVALGAYEGLHRAALTPGADLAVCGIDNVPEGASWRPPLTTVELHPRAIGRRAARALLAAIDDPATRERVHLTPRLVVRDST
ncbi:LacI family DNA-binding transcriptional regulator [Jannaschia sp. LMIT008]|uniref:LacI family DNA-binding transcriptional regulator n=1 Tax=Jannaschia maritima TaxID=3032585 RepID=UPI002810A61C|nr:LacI family DNA-binding transcriptional regulator [Jannaschia sp. LMIT008]